MRISSPGDTSCNIFVFIESSKWYVWPSHIPNVDTAINNKCNRSYVKLALWSPLHTADWCNRVDSVLQCRLTWHIPHLQQNSPFNTIFKVVTGKLKKLAFVYCNNTYICMFTQGSILYLLCNFVCFVCIYNLVHFVYN